jgi:putative NADH-flavin reductase
VPVTPASTAAGDRGESFTEELQVRAAEASTQVQAAELLGDELQASIASSDLADLRSIASRNDVQLDEVVLDPEHSG